jgi:hypothetical protein
VAVIAMMRLAIEVEHYDNGVTYRSFDFLHLPNITDPYEKKYRLIYAPNEDLNNKIMQNLIERLYQIQFNQSLQFERMTYLFYNI